MQSTGPMVGRMVGMGSDGTEVGIGVGTGGVGSAGFCAAGLGAGFAGAFGFTGSVGLTAVWSAML